MSYAVSLGGVVPSIVVALMSGMLATYTFGLLGRLCGETNLSSYRQLAEHFINAKAGPYIDLLLALYTFPQCLSYHISVLGCLEAILDELGVLANTESFYTHRWFLSILLSLFVFLPLCSTDKLHLFSFASILGVIALGYCFVYVAVNLGTSERSDLPLSDFESSLWAPPSGNPLGLLPVANIFAACYLVQYNAPSFFVNLKNKKKFQLVSNWATGIVFLFCVTFAILGFLRFGFETPDNLLLGYATAYGPWIATCVSLAATYPFVFDAGRRSVISALKNTKIGQSPKTIFWTCNLTLIPLFTLVAVFLRHLGIVIGLNGALFGNLVGFVVPGLLLIGRNGWKDSAGIALLVVGSLLVALGITAMFVEAI